jgi:PAS domain S-box-containing protein
MSPAQAGVYLQHLMDFDVVPIITWDYDGGVLSANDRFLELIGYTRADLEAGRINWKGLTPPAYLPLDEQCMRQLEGAAVADPYVKEYVRKDGSRVAVRLYNGRDPNAPRQGIAAVVGL